MARQRYKLKEKLTVKRNTCHFYQTVDRLKGFDLSHQLQFYFKNFGACAETRFEQG